MNWNWFQNVYILTSLGSRGIMFFKVFVLGMIVAVFGLQQNEHVLMAAGLPTKWFARRTAFIAMSVSRIFGLRIPYFTSAMWVSPATVERPVMDSLTKIEALFSSLRVHSIRSCQSDCEVVLALLRIWIFYVCTKKLRVEFRCRMQTRTITLGRPISFS